MRVEIGSLARLLVEAAGALTGAQQQVDDLLMSLFPGWRPRFPLELGWRFIPPAELHIFDVLDSPAAIAALRLAGFERLTLHDHAATKFLSCRCIAARSPA